MQFGSLEFTPGRWPSLIALVVLGVLVSLGFWQLDRADQKQALLDEFQGGSDQAPFRLDTTIKSFDNLQYQFASAAGNYDSEHQFLLDNRTHNGAAGYQVLTPLHLKSSEWYVLVNRGWVPLGVSRDQLPDVSVSIEEREVTGRIKLASLDGFRLGEEELRQGWPYRIQRIDTEKLSDELGYRLMPVVLLLNPEQPEGFVREWHPLTFGPERNVGYAVQWFSLALALAIIYLSVNIRKVK
jgi:surfeit locus 1 family protein